MPPDPHASTFVGCMAWGCGWAELIHRATERDVQFAALTARWDHIAERHREQIARRMFPPQKW